MASINTAQLLVRSTLAVVIPPYLRWEWVPTNMEEVAVALVVRSAPWVVEALVASKYPNTQAPASLGA